MTFLTIFQFRADRHRYIIDISSQLVWTAEKRLVGVSAFIHIA